MRETEHTVIVLRIAAERAAEFEAMFQREEIPIWDDYTKRGLFHDAKLIKVADGSEVREGVQDYVLSIVAASHAAHSEHDRDPRFKSFLVEAMKLQPKEPLVWFGEAIFERTAGGGGATGGEAGQS